MNRIEALKAMVAQNPTDAFARYGLAMELIKGGELANGIAEFRALLEHNPNYAAAYFHGGQALEKIGDVEQARELYEKGIEVTSRTGDGHTLAANCRPRWICCRFSLTRLLNSVQSKPRCCAMLPRYCVRNCHCISCNTPGVS